ncbi:hypothetical protein BJX96DRAFT_165121 [Aspergillus floccosus]
MTVLASASSNCFTHTVRLSTRKDFSYATFSPYSSLLTVPCSTSHLTSMARKRPASEANEPTTGLKRGRTSMAQKTPAARTQSTAGKRVVAKKSPRQTVQVPTKEEVAEEKGDKKAGVPEDRTKSASTKKIDIAAPKNQETARATGPTTRRKQTAANRKQKPTTSTKPKRTATPKSQRTTASTREKQTSASKNPKTSASTRQKRAAGPEEEQETPLTKKQKQSIPAAAKHDPLKIQPPFVTLPAEAKATPTRSYAYNFEFFEDMAKTIAINFPFVEFAARHSCNIHEVARVISAIIIGPLSDPSFDWYDNEDLTIPSYVMMMTEAWERHYQKALVANVQPVKSDDGSSSDSDSDASSTCSSADSSANSSSSSSNDALPGPSTEDEVSEEVRARMAKAVRTPHLSKSKYVTVGRPRVHVYKDEWGRYVPVPTKEEQDEQERRQWLEKEARRIRQNRGRGMLGQSSHMQVETDELDSLDLDVESEQENFGDMDLEVDPDLRRAVENSFSSLPWGNLGEQFGAFMF